MQRRRLPIGSKRIAAKQRRKIVDAPIGSPRELPVGMGLQGQREEAGRNVSRSVCVDRY